MGVDSGLPDFRGPEGFWKAYPAYRRLGMDFASMANPRHFQMDPALAWGFYGHRLHLYRSIQPHEGFGILKRWTERMPGGGAVFTSNVDGQFQRAGFAQTQVTEAHGSIHHLQCFKNCGAGIFAADPFNVDVDEETMRARSELPRCPSCGGLARPNILMFGDGGWDDSRSFTQERRLTAWLEANHELPLAIVELGAGTAIPTVRAYSESAVREFDGRLIRINVREPGTPSGQVGLPMGALSGLQQIDQRLTQ
jgi:NAD-dependent SIR2 family protein deacetylase